MKRHSALRLGDMAIRIIEKYIHAVGLIVIGTVAMPPTTSAATYYVSATNGNDSYTAAQAQSISTPWKTIQKAANNMAAGDTCLIRAGTYRETVTIPVSGASNSPVTFQSYGAERALISGTETITNWTLESASIYYAHMGWTLAESNQVFKSGQMQPAARWPNAGPLYPWQDSSIYPSPDWAYVETAGTNINNCNWLMCSQLPDRPDNYWNGCTLLIIPGNGRWTALMPTITSYTNATKILTTDRGSSGAAYDFTERNEFYLTGNNLKGEMDSAGEWHYDSANSRLYLYSLSTPSEVEAKKRFYGFDLSGHPYIKLINLSFFACRIKTDSISTNCVYDGLNMQYLNHSWKAIDYYAGIQLWKGDVLRNSELAYCSGPLVTLMYGNNRVINNHLHDACYLPCGQAIIVGSPGWSPTYNNKSGNFISHNTLHDSGMHIMDGLGKAAFIEYNNMYNAMRLTVDGGIFYGGMGGGNTILSYNLMHDSPGPQGIGHSVQGFYLDCQNNNYIFHHNIVWNVAGWPVQINNRQNFNMVYNNTCWNSNPGTALMMGFTGGVDGEKSGTRVFNNLFNGSVSAQASDMGCNITSLDPSFINPSNSNFQLQSNSCAIDRGTVIAGVTDGFNGMAPDIGALEYGLTNWTLSCGCQTNPIVPEPTNSFPSMTFCNQVKDGGFESGKLSPNWTTNAACKAKIKSGWSWSDEDGPVRTEIFAVQFSQGTSEVCQTVTGLLTNQSYELYGGLQVTNTASVVKLGVRNHGTSNTAVTASVKLGWTMYHLPFVTGPTNISAEVYISVMTPDGVNSEVYADDLSVEAILPITIACTNWYVATNGADGNVGTSWSAPFMTISNAIARASLVSDTIWVSNGVYTLRDMVNNPEDKACKIRAWSTNPVDTVLLGQGSNSPMVGIGCRGVWMSGAGSLLQGFTVTNFYLTNALWGAGVYCGDFGHISNCIIAGNILGVTNNAALGGGVYLKKNCTIENCVVTGNSIFPSKNETYGGGIAFAGTNGLMRNCRIVGNRMNGSATYGNGVSAGSITMQDSVIAGNTGSSDPGIRIDSGIISNCLVSANTAGGIYSTANGSDNLRIERCVIDNNSGTSIGGGSFPNGGDLLISQCVIVSNYNQYRASGGLIVGNLVKMPGSGTACWRITVAACMWVLGAKTEVAACKCSPPTH